MKKMVLLLLVALFAGCASIQVPIARSNITRFHKLEKNLTGEYGTYSMFVPDDKKTSLEFAAYTEAVKSQLNARGFKEEPNPALSNYSAFFSYSIKDAGSTTSVVSTPQMAGNSAFAKGFNSVGSSAYAITNNQYLRTVLFSLAKFSPGIPPQTVYEASLVSVGSTGQINVVMPTLIKSLFQTFPGNNGETIQVELPIEK